MADSIDPTSLDTTDGLHAALTSAVDSYGNNTATPEQVSSLKSEISGLEGKEDKVLDAEIGNLEKSFDQKPPEQDSHVLSGLMPLLAISAFGGKAVGLNANAMLGSSIGMVQGYTQGKQEVYQDNLQKYNAAYERFRDQQAQIDKVYKTMLEAYGSRVDAKQKALQAAYEMTGNQVKNLNTLLQDHENVQQWSDQLKLEHEKMEQQGTFEKMKIGIEQKKLDLMKDKLAQAGFSPQQQELLAAMADKSVSLPAGLRSQQQIRATLDGLIAAHPEMDADEIADGIKSGKLKLAAETKAAQTAGTQIGKVAIAVNELKPFGEQTIQASDAVPRGKFVPYSKLKQMAESSISDKALLRFKVKMQALENAYNQLAARSGTDADKRAHIHELFNNANSPEAVRTLVQALNEEGLGAKQAADETIGEVSGTSIPGAGSGGAPAQPPPAAAPQPVPGSPPNVVQWSTLN